MTSDAVRTAVEILGDLAELNAPLGSLTTYRVGGRAAIAVHPVSQDDLQLIARAHQESRLPVAVVGNGSNLLVSDAGFDGIAVTMSGFDAIEIDGVIVRAGGGVSLPVLSRRTVAASITGFEWAVGVPGTVGGAVRMNAGGHGSEIGECLSSARVVDLDDGSARDMSNPELGFFYRHSNVTSSQVVVEATLKLEAGNTTESQERLSEIVRWRREHQPGGQNAGSCFTNPPGQHAGAMIDAAGLKGFRVGSAHVHEKHANFVQADEGGSARDVFAVIREVQQRVEQKTGVCLIPEVRLLGDFASDDLSQGESS